MALFSAASPAERLRSAGSLAITAVEIKKVQKRKIYYKHGQKKKSIQGWHNIYHSKLYVENKSKQITCIQKSRTGCLKGIVYIGCRRRYKAIF